MCPSEVAGRDRPRHRLEVQTEDEDARVIVLDARDRVAADGPCDDGAASFDLPAGLYTVRVALSGRIAERMIRLTGDQRLALEAPKRRSPAPLRHGSGQRYATTHEHFTDPAVAHSSRHTRGPLDGSGSTMMVFLRSEDGAASRVTGLSVCSEDGRRLARFADDEVAREAGAGRWMALSAPTRPAEYLLRYEGPGVRREMPLLVVPGFHTYVFVAVAADLDGDGQPGPAFPRLEGASVMMSDGRFEPDDSVTLAVDRALDVLDSGRGDVRGRGMNMLLHGKFQNPILGLVGLHVMLGRAEPPRADLLDMVLGNTARLLGSCPDIRALELRVATALGRPLDLTPIERPPILRAGYEAVLRAAADHPALIAPDSPLEWSTLRALSDSPWTTWTPGAAPLFSLAVADAPAAADDEAQTDFYDELGLDDEEVVERIVEEELEDDPDDLDDLDDLDDSGDEDLAAPGSVGAPVAAPDAGPGAGGGAFAPEVSRPVRAPRTKTRVESRRVSVEPPPAGPTPVWVQRAVLESGDDDVRAVSSRLGVAPRLVDETVRWIRADRQLRARFDDNRQRARRRRRRK